jgi:hypothetical protein
MLVIVGVNVGAGVLVGLGVLVAVAVAVGVTVGGAVKLIMSWAEFTPDSRLGKLSEDVLGVVIPKLYEPSPVM